MSGYGLATQRKPLAAEIHHAVGAVFYCGIRLLRKAEAGKHRYAVVVSGIHLAVIAARSGLPCAKAVIPPCGSHAAAFVHLAVILSLVIYLHCVFIKYTRGNARKRIPVKAHPRAVIFLREFKPGHGNKIGGVIGVQNAVYNTQIPHLA